MTRVLRGRLFFVALFVAALGWCSLVQADPLPGETIKFQQKPLDGLILQSGTPPFFGHDELSTATLGTAGGPVFSGFFMADDFSDKISQPVVHLSWWGSYLQNQPFGGVNRFLISFESDVPASPTGGFSHPGQPLVSQVVTKGPLAPASGTFTEVPVSPGGPPLGETLYKYNAELKLPFPEQANTVYWLKIAALVNPQNEGPIQWGWHDRDYRALDPFAAGPPVPSPGEFDEAFGAAPFAPVWHFQDDAVSGTMTTSLDAAGNVLFLDQAGFAPQRYLDGIDGPSGISQYSKDLAFELYYRDIPEPGSVMLVLVGAGLTTLRRRR